MDATDMGSAVSIIETDTDIEIFCHIELFIGLLKIESFDTGRAAAVANWFTCAMHQVRGGPSRVTGMSSLAY